MAATHPDRMSRRSEAERFGAPDAGKWGAARGCRTSSRPHRLRTRVASGQRRVRRNRSHGAAPEATVADAALVPDLSVAAPRVRLGDLLVHSGIVTRDALEQGLAARQRHTPRHAAHRARDDRRRRRHPRARASSCTCPSSTCATRRRSRPRPRSSTRPTRTATTCCRSCSPTARSPSRSPTRSTPKSWRCCARCR